MILEDGIGLEDPYMGTQIERGEAGCSVRDQTVFVYWLAEGGTECEEILISFDKDEYGLVPLWVPISGCVLIIAVATICILRRRKRAAASATGTEAQE